MSDDKPSALEALVREWPLTFGLELTKYSLAIGSGVSTIRFSCNPRRRLLHGIRITADDKTIDDLPVELVVRADQSTFDKLKDQGPVGYLEFCESIKTDDGVVNDPAMAEGVVVVSNSAFDNIMALLLQEGATAVIALDVKGLDLDSPFGKRWDVLKAPRLDITDFRFVLPDRTVDQPDKRGTIVRIEELLVELLNCTVLNIRALWRCLQVLWEIRHGQESGIAV